MTIPSSTQMSLTKKEIGGDSSAQQQQGDSAAAVTGSAGQKRSTSDTTGLPIISLKVLPILKERQLQHGLRHGDYQRYHGYCTRRLRRLRECLKLPQGDRRHYKKKDVTIADLESPKGDSRLLEIPLTMAERGWAYAMELKEYSNTEPRKRYHLIARLQKAMNCSKELLTLANGCSRVDARTKLECEAYSAFIHGTFYFEMQLWSEAVESYKKTQAIYSQLGQALGEDPEASIYEEKNAELLPSMRFCAYQKGEELDISELSSQFQSAAIEAMISAKAKMTEFTFRDHKISIPTEKLAALLVRIEDLEKKSTKKVEMYEEILMELRDAIQDVRDTIQKEQQEGKTPKPSMLLSYLLYLRLKLTVARTELMIKEKKKNQPKDCIRFTEMIVHNLQEMKTVPGLESDDDFQNEIDEISKLYKGLRYRFIADIMKSTKVWDEALTVNAKAIEYLQGAQKALPKDSPYVKIIVEEIEYLKGSSLACRSKSLLDSLKDTSDFPFKLTRPEKPLLDRLDEFVFDESLKDGTPPGLSTFPPTMEPIPCKPMFFDLATHSLDFPIEELEAAAGATKKSPSKQAQGSLTGFVKGLWGWGGKK